MFYSNSCMATILRFLANENCTALDDYTAT